MKGALLLIIILLVLIWFINNRSEKRVEQFSAPPFTAVMSNLKLDKGSDMTKKVESCYNEYTKDIRMTPEDCKSFMSCMEAAGMKEDDLRNSMPELAQCAGPPSPASGDFDYKIAPNMYNLYSQISPGSLTEGWSDRVSEGWGDRVSEGFSNEQSVDGYDPMGQQFGSPSEGFTTGGHQVAMKCMSDPYRHCERKYGSSDWAGYSQCVYTGEGMQYPY